MTNGPIGNVRTGSVKGARSEQLRVKMAPTSLRPLHEKGQSDQENKFFRQIHLIEVVAVNRLIHVHVLPGDHGVHVKKQPPGEQ